MRKFFDWRYLLVAVIVNGVPVFFINLEEGGRAGASLSGLVQFFVSASMAGFSMPYCVRNALRPDAVSAYFRSSLVMAVGVATYGGLIHYVAHTPDLTGTIVWNFGLNICAGAVTVFLKRNETNLPAWLQNLAKRL